ncbi:Hsp20 family protein [Candidatus Woesearchaeota archaeon]|nr:Hsp20 family protein [Candidatus Woesearchaeota archaeon]
MANWLSKKTTIPKISIEDKKTKIEITAELPGIDKKNITAKVKRDQVEIKAEQKKEKEIKKKDFYKQERSYSGFYRQVRLPEKVIPSKAKKTYKNGVMKIIVPKAKK